MMRELNSTNLPILFLLFILLSILMVLSVFVCLLLPIVPETHLPHSTVFITHNINVEQGSG